MSFDPSGSKNELPRAELSPIDISGLSSKSKLRSISQIPQQVLLREALKKKGVEIDIHSAMTQRRDSATTSYSSLASQAFVNNPRVASNVEILDVLPRDLERTLNEIQILSSSLHIDQILFPYDLKSKKYVQVPENSLISLSIYAKEFLSELVGSSNVPSNTSPFAQRTIHRDDEYVSVNSNDSLNTGVSSLSKNYNRTHTNIGLDRESFSNLDDSLSNEPSFITVQKLRRIFLCSEKLPFLMGSFKDALSTTSPFSLLPSTMAAPDSDSLATTRFISSTYISPFFLSVQSFLNVFTAFGTEKCIPTISNVDTTKEIDLSKTLIVMRQTQLDIAQILGSILQINSFVSNASKDTQAMKKSNASVNANFIPISLHPTLLCQQPSKEKTSVMVLEGSLISEVVHGVLFSTYRSAVDIYGLYLESSLFSMCESFAQETLQIMSSILVALQACLSHLAQEVQTRSLEGRDAMSADVTSIKQVGGDSRYVYSDSFVGLFGFQGWSWLLTDSSRFLGEVEKRFSFSQKQNNEDTINSSFTFYFQVLQAAFSLKTLTPSLHSQSPSLQQSAALKLYFSEKTQYFASQLLYSVVWTHRRTLTRLSYPFSEIRLRDSVLLEFYRLSTKQYVEVLSTQTNLVSTFHKKPSWSGNVYFPMHYARIFVKSTALLCTSILETLVLSTTSRNVENNQKRNQSHLSPADRTSSTANFLLLLCSDLLTYIRQFLPFILGSSERETEIMPILSNLLESGIFSLTTSLYATFLATPQSSSDIKDSKAWADTQGSIVIYQHPLTAALFGFCFTFIRDKNLVIQHTFLAKLLSRIFDTRFAAVANPTPPFSSISSFVLTFTRLLVGVLFIAPLPRARLWAYRLFQSTVVAITTLTSDSTFVLLEILQSVTYYFRCLTRPQDSDHAPLIHSSGLIRDNDTVFLHRSFPFLFQLENTKVISLRRLTMSRTSRKRDEEKIMTPSFPGCLPFDMSLSSSKLLYSIKCNGGTNVSCSKVSSTPLVYTRSHCHMNRSTVDSLKSPALLLNPYALFDTISITVQSSQNTYDQRNVQRSFIYEISEVTFSPVILGMQAANILLSEISEALLAQTNGKDAPHAYIVPSGQIMNYNLLVQCFEECDEVVKNLYLVLNRLDGEEHGVDKSFFLSYRSCFTSFFDRVLKSYIDLLQTHVGLLQRIAFSTLTDDSMVNTIHLDSRSTLFDSRIACLFSSLSLFTILPISSLWRKSSKSDHFSILKTSHFSSRAAGILSLLETFVQTFPLVNFAVDSRDSALYRIQYHNEKLESGKLQQHFIFNTLFTFCSSREDAQEKRDVAKLSQKTRCESRPGFEPTPLPSAQLSVAKSKKQLKKELKKTQKQVKETKEESSAAMRTNSSLSPPEILEKLSSHPDVLRISLLLYQRVQSFIYEFIQKVYFKRLDSHAVFANTIHILTPQTRKLIENNFDSLESSKISENTVEKIDLERTFEVSEICKTSDEPNVFCNTLYFGLIMSLNSSSIFSASLGRETEMSELKKAVDLNNVVGSSQTCEKKTLPPLKTEGKEILNFSITSSFITSALANILSVCRNASFIYEIVSPESISPSLHSLLCVSIFHHLPYFSLFLSRWEGSFCDPGHQKTLECGQSEDISRRSQKNLKESNVLKSTLKPTHFGLTSEEVDEWKLSIIRCVNALTACGFVQSCPLKVFSMQIPIRALFSFNPFINYPPDSDFTLNQRRKAEYQGEPLSPLFLSFITATLLGVSIDPYSVLFSTSYLHSSPSSLLVAGLNSSASTTHTRKALMVHTVENMLYFSAQLFAKALNADCHRATENANREVSQTSDYPQLWALLSVFVRKASAISKVGLESKQMTYVVINPNETPLYPDQHQHQHDPFALAVALVTPVACTEHLSLFRVLSTVILTTLFNISSLMPIPEELLALHSSHLFRFLFTNDSVSLKFPRIEPICQGDGVMKEVMTNLTSLTRQIRETKGVGTKEEGSISLSVALLRSLVDTLNAFRYPLYPILFHDTGHDTFDIPHACLLLCLQSKITGPMLYVWKLGLSKAEKIAYQCLRGYLAILSLLELFIPPHYRTCEQNEAELRSLPSIQTLQSLTSLDNGIERSQSLDIMTSLWPNGVKIAQEMTQEIGYTFVSFMSSIQMVKKIQSTTDQSKVEIDLLVVAPSASETIFPKRTIPLSIRLLHLISECILVCKRLLERLFVNDSSFLLTQQINSAYQKLLEQHPAFMKTR